MKRTIVASTRIGLFPLLLLFLVPLACKAQDRHDADPELEVVDASTNSGEGLLNDRDEANRDIDASRRTAITRAVARAAPAVVGINVTEVREVSAFPGIENDPMFRQFRDMFPRYRERVQGLGSGFIISPDGYVVTNDHVAGMASEVIVTTTDGTQHPARMIGTDRTTDVTVLKIEGDRDFPYLEIAPTNDVLIGEWAIALGNPFGLFDINAQPTVTVGVVSNAGLDLRPQDDRVYIDMIQTDAAISSGNSGGPLVNALGEVIGMNTIIYSTATSYQGAGSIGIGFAVPIDRVMRIVEDLKRDGAIDRDFWTGLNIRAIDARIARYLDRESTDGAVVVGVARESPAAAAGIEQEDVIVALDGEPVRTDEDVILYVNDARVGDTLSFTIERRGERLEKKMVLTRR